MGFKTVQGCRKSSKESMHVGPSELNWNRLSPSQIKWRKLAGGGFKAVKVSLEEANGVQLLSTESKWSELKVSCRTVRYKDCKWGKASSNESTWLWKWFQRHCVFANTSIASYVIVCMLLSGFWPDLVLFHNLCDLRHQKACLDCRHDSAWLLIGKLAEFWCPHFSKTL